MNARELMTSHVVTCPAFESLERAAQMMWEADVGAVGIVSDSGRLTGIVTDRDVCMAAYTQGRPLRDIMAVEVMSKELVSCGAEDSIRHVEELMRKHQVRRIPVLDDELRPIGVVSMNDLVRAVNGSHRGQGELIATLAAIGQPRQQLTLSTPPEDQPTPSRRRTSADQVAGGQRHDGVNG